MQAMLLGEMRFNWLKRYEQSAIRNRLSAEARYASRSQYSAACSGLRQPLLQLSASRPAQLAVASGWRASASGEDIRQSPLSQ